MNLECIQRQLSELQLIQCSLLPDEHLALLDSSPFWQKALESYAEYNFLESIDLDAAAVASPVSFELKVDGANTWFQVTLPSIGASESEITAISVKGENITRAEQENWQSMIAEKRKEIDDSEFPAYQLLSLHLLPQLRENINSFSERNLSGANSNDCIDTTSNSVIYHVLFTSHHLLCPNKRRSLQHWSSSLSLNGFAEVGYPGVIYAEGEQRNIEEFVDNIKGMQWLGLKVRFVEPLDSTEHPKHMAQRQWIEFHKVGEVVQEMRRTGREGYVVEMGIGSLGSNSNPA